MSFWSSGEKISERQRLREIREEGTEMIIEIKHLCFLSSKQNITENLQKPLYVLIEKPTNM